MRRSLLSAILIFTAGVPIAQAESWTMASARGDYAAAATLLQRAVFEHPEGQRPAPAALRQLALLYFEGKGVARDPVLACSLARAHAEATAEHSRVVDASMQAAATLVDRYCSPLPATQRAAANAAMSCPRLGISGATTVALEPGAAIRFNDRSATITRQGETREQPLAEVLCRTQVLRIHHTPLLPANGSSADLRHMIELVTVQSAWRNGTLSRELVWQLYEVRGLQLDLAAVQRWREPGSAWPAPALPEPLARGAVFTVLRSGEVGYEIPDATRGTLAGRRSQ